MAEEKKETIVILPDSVRVSIRPGSHKETKEEKKNGEIRR